MIISRTPFRVSFFGGGTDYPVWYREHGGAVLSTTIDKYCYLSCRYLPPFFDHKSRGVYSKIEYIFKNNEEFKHPSMRETLRFLKIKEGVEIHHDGDLPARAGLGSSSAFTVGLLHTLYAMKRVMPTKIQLAKQAIFIERKLIKESVGSQDQVAVAFGGLNKISFSQNDDITIEPVIMKRERLLELEHHLILCFTGFSRHASKIAVTQIKNTPNKRSELASMRSMVDDALAILTNGGNINDFGKLLHESWMLKRGLTNKVTTSHIDDIYDTARRAGAVGGKLLGAGGGGFMLLFAKPKDHEKIKKALKNILFVPFRFESGGSQIIFMENLREKAPTWK